MRLATIQTCNLYGLRIILKKVEDNIIGRGVLRPLFIKNKQEGRHAIALWLVSEYSIKTLNVKERESFVFKDGYYIPAQNFLRSEIQSILGALITSNVLNETIMQVQNITLVDRDIFNPPLNLINLSNGVYDINSKLLLPHNPTYNFLTKLPIIYDKNALCPTIKNFLNSIVQDGYIDVLQEWFGFLLYRDYFIKKATIIVGPGNTGKTTLLNLVESFIGKENSSGISLQKLAGDKFAGANLYQKYANVFDDMSAKDITDSASFKMATGKSSITGEFKFGSQFKFTNYAKMIFSCNSIPGTEKMGDPAYSARWIVLNLTKEISNPDPSLEAKLTTPEELSGLFNYALEGLERLITNGRFSYNFEPHEIKNQMLRSGSPIAKFVYDCLEEELDAWISKDDLYNEFIKFANKNQMQSMTKDDFGKKLQNYAGYISDSKKSILGKQQTGWRNVKLKREEVLEDNDFEGYEG